MGIVDEDVARVRDATDLVALVGEHIALEAGRPALRRRCARSTRRRRRRSRSTPRSVSWHCFGCQTSGDAITFVREVEHLDFVDAVERLARVPASRSATTTPPSAGPQAQGAPERGGRRRRSTSTTGCCSRHPTRGKARQYLREPRLRRRRRPAVRLGWSPDDWDVLSRPPPAGEVRRARHRRRRASRS